MAANGGGYEKLLIAGNSCQVKQMDRHTTCEI